MAHLPNDELPSEFDVIIDGTGLVQSLLAAALARSGKSILHLDRNSYYGDTWANLMYRDVESLVKGEMEELRVFEGSVSLEENQKKIDTRVSTIPPHTSNIKRTVYQYDEQRSSQDQPVAAPVQPDHQDLSEEDHPEVITQKEPSKQEPLSSKEEPSEQEASRQEPLSSKEEPSEQEASRQEPSEQEPSEQGPPGEESQLQAGILETPQQEQDKELMKKIDLESEVKSSSSFLLWEALQRKMRSLCMDFAPTLLFGRGPMVDILMTSDVGRYLEFHVLRRLLAIEDERIEQVPCSRSDLFSTKTVSMTEKRKMMKFLTFCVDYEQHSIEYADSLNVTFAEFLKSKELTPNLVKYIVHSIACVALDAPLLEGLKATQTFLKSLGRYGNTPFIFPLYGSGDVTQAFCRFAAVYSGIYCLNRTVNSLIINTEDQRVSSIVCTAGQNIKCSHVVASPRLLTRALQTDPFVKTLNVSHAVLLTDASLLESDNKGISQLSILPGSLGDGQTQLVKGLELDASSCCCPVDTYLIHLLCPSTNSTAEEDLKGFVERYLATPDMQVDGKPHLLWSIFFNQEWLQVDQLHCHSENSEVPANVHLVSDPTLSSGYEAAVSEARAVFQRICPGEEFLPAPVSQEEVSRDSEEELEYQPSEIKEQNNE